MESVIKNYVKSKKAALIKLRGDLALLQGIGGIGPGVISQTPWTADSGIYLITQGGELNGTIVEMSFYFCGDDVIWISEQPDLSGVVAPDSGIHIS